MSEHNGDGIDRRSFVRTVGAGVCAAGLGGVAAGDGTPRGSDCQTANEWTRSGSVSPQGLSTYSYEVRSDDLCELQIILTGRPQTADVDLLVTTDGSIPTPTDSHIQSRSRNGLEEIVIERGVREIGVAVHSLAGQPVDYDLQINELGSGGGSRPEEPSDPRDPRNPDDPRDPQDPQNPSDPRDPQDPRDPGYPGGGGGSGPDLINEETITIDQPVDGAARQGIYDIVSDNPARIEFDVSVTRGYGDLMLDVDGMPPKKDPVDSQWEANRRRLDDWTRAAKNAPGEIIVDEADDTVGWSFVYRTGWKPFAQDDGVFEIHIKEYEYSDEVGTGPRVINQEEVAIDKPVDVAAKQGLYDVVSENPRRIEFELSVSRGWADLMLKADAEPPERDPVNSDWEASRRDLDAHERCRENAPTTLVLEDVNAMVGWALVFGTGWNPFGPDEGSYTLTITEYV